ncbi:hypothetical protein F4818DRAFT_166237 [Hypoxylon cercidicola]|nr:hypothetical protein F4818DRAFT_166237 [Hypoxylon cercidicola]
MSLTTWKALPPELKANVCELLYDADPLSLVNLACADKGSHAVASIFLFRTIKIFVNERDQPHAALEDHIRDLQRLEAQKHVRRLVIYGPGRRNPVLTGFGYEEPEVRRILDYVPDLERENDEGPFRTRFDKHTGVDNLDNISNSAFVPDASPVAATYQFDEQWRPLANLIRQSPVLGDVIYQCSTQFPPCLLEALHERQPGWPRCRLHLDTFKLRCLSSRPLTADHHELMLISSPCLHSIHIRTGSRVLHNRQYWLPTHHLGVVLRLVAGVAPNIKEVHVSSMQDCPNTQPGERHSSFSPPWETLPIPRAGPRGEGLLSCLQLRGTYGCAIDERIIDDWSTHTDFTALRTLKLDSEIGKAAFETLADKHSFPLLETLAISLRVSPADRHTPARNDTREYCLLVERFLRGLPRLISLKMIGWIYHIPLDSALGSGLETLWLESGDYSVRLSKRHIALVRARCPLLKDLTLVICRSKGNFRERAIYEELGTLPKLQYLSLRMDPMRVDSLCKGTHWDFDSFVGFDRGSPFDFYSELLPPPFDLALTRGQVRDMFVNSAMDGALAIAIFEAISKTKKRDNLVPLKKLEIRLVDANLSALLSQRENFELEKYIAMLGHSWQVVRMPRDGAGQVPIAREINKEERERTNRLIEENIRRLRRQSVYKSPLETIFRRIWPERWEGSPLQEDWYSWPLSPDTTS